jgi:hypothetical protein
MAVKLHEAGYLKARKLIEDRQVQLDDMDAWSEHQPSAAKENRFIQQVGFEEFGRWFLAVDDEYADDTKAYYRFPFGDFARVHRCALLSAESRAARHRYRDIENACTHLHGMLEVLRATVGPEPEP